MQTDSMVLQRADYQTQFMTTVCQVPKPVASYPKALLVFDSQVSSTRNSYRAVLRNLPAPFDALALRHLEARLDRTGERPLLGEFAPWMIADALKLRTSEKLNEIAKAWLHLYFSVMLLDDVIDDNNYSSGQLLLLISLLQQRGIVGMLRALPNPQLGRSMDAAFLKMLTAAHDELENHRGRIKVYDKAGIQQVGAKLALIEVCTQAVGRCANVSESRLDLLRGIFAEFSHALQLLDDLTDWKEDYQARSMTLPLTLAASRNSLIFAQDDPTPLKWPIFATLVKTGALADTLGLALELLKSSREKLQEHFESKSCFNEFLCGLIDSGSSLYTSLGKTKEILAHTEILLIVSSPDTMRLLRDIERRMRVVAQSS